MLKLIVELIYMQHKDPFVLLHVLDMTWCFCTIMVRGKCVSAAKVFVATRCEEIISQKKLFKTESVPLSCKNRQKDNISF